MIWKESLPCPAGDKKSMVRVKLYWSPTAASERARLQLSTAPGKLDSKLFFATTLAVVFVVLL